MRRIKFGFTELLNCLLAVAEEIYHDDEEPYTDYDFTDTYALDEFAALCKDFGIHIHVEHNLEQAWLSWSAVTRLAAKLWPRGKRGKRNEEGDLIKDLFLMLAWDDTAYVQGEWIKSLPPHNYRRQAHEKRRPL